MVYIEKDYKNPPSKLIDKKWDKIKKDVLSDKKHEADSKCYRDSILEDLLVLYSNKCAYCERSCGTELQIDHYRPKKAREIGSKEFQHTGYYWLTYEWTNLMPLCSNCNQNKSNFFPIKKSRVTDHKHINSYDISWLNQQEEPLFINPEIEKIPLNHFKYLPNGEVVGRTDEGKYTVKYYLLNSRNKKIERLTIINNYIDEINNALNEFKNSIKKNKKSELRGALKNIFYRISKNTLKTEPFSLLHVYIQQYFNEFIAKKIPLEMQNILIKNFKKYKQNLTINP